jgi:hypothetical protein
MPTLISSGQQIKETFYTPRIGEETIATIKHLIDHMSFVRTEFLQNEKATEIKIEGDIRQAMTVASVIGKHAAVFLI